MFCGPGWSVSRKLRNRLAHALNGNGTPDRPPASGWRSVGRRGLTARQLQEPLSVGKPRSEGWSVPATVGDDVVVRVYDTCVGRDWLHGIVRELQLGLERVVLVGGDFLLPPDKEDRLAMTTGRLERWGPNGKEPYHVVVPPRHHVVDWMQRARQQLPLEAAGTWFSVGFVVPREDCPEKWDEAAMRKVLPKAACVFADDALEVRVFAVGERAHILRVPADVQQLPPPRWELGLLPRNRVVLFVSFRQRQGPRPAITCRWLRDPPPPVKVEDVELFRLEYLLPPATKAAAGERALRVALRKVATAIGKVSPGNAQLRQVQPSQGAMFALLGVPRAEACHWLRGSGCEGLYIRPFWNPSTGKDVARSRFELLWLRGRLDMGPRVWEALREVPGVYGLLWDGKDLGVRVTEEADRRVIQSQVQFVLGADAQLRGRAAGVQWWKLGPLTEAELWDAKSLIGKTGLTLARDELRQARMGPFRFAVFFTATGDPRRWTLDDGSWNSSEARLWKAEPPPRRKTTNGQALTPQSTWGGPRTATSRPVDFEHSVTLDSSIFPPPVAVSTPTVWPPLEATTSQPDMAIGNRGKPRPGRGSGRSSGKGSMAGSQPTVVRVSHGAFESLGAPSAANDLVALQLARLTQELQEMRKENAALRRQVEALRGLQQHEPYAPITAPPEPVTPVRAPPAPARVAGDLSPAPPDESVVGNGDAIMQSPPLEGDSKKARRSFGNLAEADAERSVMSAAGAPPRSDQQ